MTTSAENSAEKTNGENNNTHANVMTAVPINLSLMNLGLGIFKSIPPACVQLVNDLNPGNELPSLCRFLRVPRGTLSHTCSPSCQQQQTTLKSCKEQRRERGCALTSMCLLPTRPITPRRLPCYRLFAYAKCSYQVFSYAKRSYRTFAYAKCSYQPKSSSVRSNSFSNLPPVSSTSLITHMAPR